MSVEVMQFLAFGLFGEKLIRSFDPDNWMTLLPFGILVAVTVVALKCMGAFKRNKRYLGVLLIIVVYICLIGAVCGLAMLILWLILRMIGGSDEKGRTKPPPRSPQEAAACDAEVEAAYQRLYRFSLRLDNCLTEDKKSEFARESSYLIYSSSAAPEDYDALIRCWQHYLYNPMPGSRNGPRL